MNYDYNGNKDRRQRYVITFQHAGTARAIEAVLAVDFLWSQRFAGGAVDGVAGHGRGCLAVVRTALLEDSSERVLYSQEPPARLVCLLGAEHRSPRARASGWRVAAHFADDGQSSIEC